ncbi:MAG: argininosuccinate synthase [Balneolaceae bacterium]|nr:MAG: argininosuccinate synthase [Balneolaceae bacterium]
MSNIIVLAYSGGLDTSFCIPWLREKYGAEIHAVMVDCYGIGPDEEEVVRERAIRMGAKAFTLIDGFPPLYSKIISNLIRGNVLRDRTYPLSVGAERFIQAEGVVKYARSIGTNRVAHGSTGAGNDQVRFDVAVRTLMADAEIITPIRDEGLTREQTTGYLRGKGFDVPDKTTSYSINSGIWGTTIGGRETTTSDKALPFEAFPELKAPHEYDDKPEDLTLTFELGLPVAINGDKLEPRVMLSELHQFGVKHGIGRGMHLGDTIIGIKGRIGFEAPVATIIYTAHRDLEKLVLSKWQRHVKDSLADMYGMLLHEAQYFDPVMRDIEALFAASQKVVKGDVQLYAYRGNLFVKGASSPYSLMNNTIARYGEEAGGWTGEEARAFSKIFGISTRISQQVQKP